MKQKVRECQQKANYVSKVTPEQRKEYNKRAYLKRKEKTQNTEIEII